MSLLYYTYTTKENTNFVFFPLFLTLSFSLSQPRQSLLCEICVCVLPSVVWNSRLCFALSSLTYNDFSKSKWFVYFLVLSPVRARACSLSRSLVRHARIYVCTHTHTHMYIIYKHICIWGDLAHFLIFGLILFSILFSLSSFHFLLIIWKRVSSLCWRKGGFCMCSRECVRLCVCVCLYVCVCVCTWGIFLILPVPIAFAFHFWCSFPRSNRVFFAFGSEHQACVCAGRGHSFLFVFLVRLFRFDWSSCLWVLILW